MSSYTVTIEVDEEPLHPRHDCENNVGMLYTFPRFPYDIGDHHNLSTGDLLGLANAFIKSDVPLLPVYMFNHSGQSFYTQPKGDVWDESHVGFIFLNVAKYLEASGRQRMGKHIKARAYDWLRQEVEEINEYYNTTYYYASVFENSDPDYVIDSMSGFESEEAARRWAGDLLASITV